MVDATWVRLSHAKGLPELRDRARMHFFAKLEPSPTPRMRYHRWSEKPGSSAALRAACGARVLRSSFRPPTWPSYFDICSAARTERRRLRDGSGPRIFALDLDRTLNAKPWHAERGRSCSPNPCNPTGSGFLPAAEFGALADLCRRQDMLLVIDQSFSQVIFDEGSMVPLPRVVSNFDRPPSPPVIDSFSKNRPILPRRPQRRSRPCLRRKWLVEPFRSPSTRDPSFPAPPRHPVQEASHFNALDTDFAMPSLAGAARRWPPFLH